MKIRTEKNTLAVIFGNRNFFPSYLVGEARKGMEDVLKEMKLDYLMAGENKTPYGGIETYQEAAITAEFLQENRDKIKGIIVVLPNFGDEKAIANTIRMAGLCVPVLVQAVSDDLDKMGLATRRDSFCGKISLCNNLRQYGIPFSLTSRHVCALNSDIFKQDLQKFDQLCHVVHKMKNCRLGAIGARPAGFNTVRFSEKILENLGIAVETIDLSEIFAAAKALEASDSRIAEKLALLKANADTKNIPQEKLDVMAKLFVVISEWVTDNDLDATAILCWTSLQKTLGINVCSIMSTMSGQLIPSACEVDIMGALSMYGLSMASQKPASLADWNNNYGDDPNKCVLFHCGNYATEELINPFMSTADIIGTTVGCENTCGAIDGRLKAGPLTYFRLSTDDLAGRVKAYVGEGQFVDNPLETIGCRAVVEVAELEELLAYICNNGFEHHVAMNHSSSADILYEAFTKYLGIECYYHKS